MSWYARAALLLGLGLAAASLAASRPSTAPTSSIVEERRSVIDACLKVLKGHQAAARAVSREEHEAIWTLGIIRASEGSQTLVRLIGVVNGAARLDPIVGSEMQVRSLLSDYPCANALVLIGIPGVQAIVQRLHDREAISSIEAELFAEVLRHVLGSRHAKPFLELEAKEAREDGRANFDKVLRQQRLVSTGLLAMPASNPARP